MSVLVEDATQAFVSAYVETSDLHRVGDRRGQWVQWAGVGDACPEDNPAICDFGASVPLTAA